MKIDVYGYDLDNLLRVLYSKNVELKNVVKIDNFNLSFEIKDSKARQIEKYLKNYKCKYTPNFFNRLPNLLLTKLGLIIAITISSVLYCFAYQYVWQIEIFGNEQITSQEIVQILKNNGISVGSKVSWTNQEIESILLGIDRIAQVSVIKVGTKITINLSEKLVYKTQTYQPIVAKYAGIVEQINLISGTINVAVGDYVNVGDVLVLPYNFDRFGNKIDVEPMAEITATIYVVGKVEQKHIQQELIRTGKIIKTYEYFLRGKKIFYGKQKNTFAFFDSYSYNNFITDVLPIERRTIEFYELALTSVEYDLEKEKSNIIQKSKDEAYKNLPQDYTIKTEQTSSQIIEDTLFATTILTVQGIIND